ncbi:hypothetical protein GGR51DRAFT_326056 [Nemania sp. FL0031]|nr:hypothetical protein GGR51DRAFT_326056 [Nemania sp. FL0031]
MEKAKGKEQESNDAAPPSYDEASHGGLQAASTAATDSKRPNNRPEDAPEVRPTVDSPFNFPPAYTVSPSHTGESTAYSDKEVHSPSGYSTYSDLPEVAGTSSSAPAFSSSSSPHILLAIPQLAAQPTSPFLSAYNTGILLRRGIPPEAFTSFLNTLSAFLTATVSDRALAHAADVGRGVKDIPKKFSKDTLAHAKSVGRHIGESAKQGRFIAAGIGAIAGTVSIPVSAALRIVDATVHQLPAAVGGGLSKKPLTPRERADAYVSVAQRDLFAPRGLVVRLCNTAELVLLNAEFRGEGPGEGERARATAGNLVDLAHRTSERGPEGQLLALQTEFGFAPLEVTPGRADGGKPLDIGTSTLWLVVKIAPDEG